MFQVGVLQNRVQRDGFITSQHVAEVAKLESSVGLRTSRTRIFSLRTWTAPGSGGCSPSGLWSACGLNLDDVLELADLGGTVLPAAPAAGDRRASTVTSVFARIFSGVAGLPFSRSATEIFRPAKPTGRQLALEVHHVVDKDVSSTDQIEEL